MEFNILGPFEVYDSSGSRLQLPAGRERALLVALLLRRGQVVSVDALIDVLWGERPPSTAAKAVQGYVSHLRRALGPESAGSEGVLATQSPGYVLHVEEGHVDASRFERLATQGQRALEDGEPAEALTILESALSLWRGAPLAEFAFEDFARSEIQRLTERRLEAIEDRIEALLQLGRHGGLVSELEALIGAHPLRERLRGQTMLALYRSGRQAEALHVYKEGGRLARELGLDPAAELKRLERAILDQDPSIAAPPRDRIPDGDRPQPADSAPPPDVAGPAPRSAFRRRRTVLVGALIAAVATLGTVGAIALSWRSDGPTSVMVVPPAVAVIDPKTNRVVASIRVGSKPVTITAGDGAVWVGDARDGTVTRIDPVSRELKTIGIGAPVVDIAASDGSVWVATGGFGTVVRIDADLGAVADRIDLGNPRDPVVPAASSIAAGREGVWVGAFDGLVRIDPRSGDITARVDLGQTPALQIAVGGGAVWATTVTSRAKRIEASSAQETAEFYAGKFVFGIALDATAVWVGGVEGELWKIDPVTGSTLGTSNVGTVAIGLALGSGAVWVTDPGDGTLVRVDPATGEVQATIPVGGPAEEVVVAGGLIWVTVQELEAEN